MQRKSPSLKGRFGLGRKPVSPPTSLTHSLPHGLKGQVDAKDSNSTSDAPRVPLADIQPVNERVTQGDPFGEAVNTSPAPAATREHRRSSIASFISTMFSNVISRSPSSRRSVVPVRGPDGNFLPPMHLAQRKGSRYAQPKESTQGKESLKNIQTASDAKPSGRLRSLKEELEIQHVEKPVELKLKTLRLVNKVLSDGQPVANLVPIVKELEVRQSIIEDRETKQRVVVVEIKVAQTPKSSVPVKRRETGRGIASAKSNNASKLAAKPNFPVRTRSIPYKPTDPSTRMPRKVSATATTLEAGKKAEPKPIRVTAVHQKGNTLKKRERNCNTGRTQTFQSAAPASANAFVKKSPKISAGKALVNTFIGALTRSQSRSSSVSSASVSPASTPSPSPTKQKAKPLVLRRKPATINSRLTKKADIDGTDVQLAKESSNPARKRVVPSHIRTSRYTRNDGTVAVKKSTPPPISTSVEMPQVLRTVTSAMANEIDEVSLMEEMKEMNNASPLPGLTGEGDNVLEAEPNVAVQVSATQVGPTSVELLQAPSKASEVMEENADFPQESAMVVVDDGIATSSYVPQPIAPESSGNTIAASDEVTSTSNEATATQSSRVKSMLQRFQQLPTPVSSPVPFNRRGSRTPSPQTADSPAVYSLRPVIPEHLANKTVADPAIQLELDFLRAKSFAARSRSVLERASVFGGGNQSDSDGEKDTGSAGPSTPGGYWRGLETPRSSSPEDERNDGGAACGQDDTPETKYSLRAMAIAHRIRLAKTPSPEREI